VFSPAARIASARTVISLATQERLFLSHFDVQAAFVSSDVDKDIFIQLPPGYELPPGKAAKLKRSLYGLRQASALFYRKLRAWLLDYGFVSIGDDGTLFRYERGTDVMILSLYVDDGIIATSSQQCYSRFLADFRKVFEISDQGPLSYYLGISVDYDRERGVAFLSQERYCLEVLERFQMQNCKPASTPFAPDTHLTGDDCCDRADPKNKYQIKHYQQLVGALLYLSGGTRPDIAYAVNQLAKFMSNPGTSHVVAAKRVLRYLAGTTRWGVRYQRQPAESANLLWGYVDSDHAGNPEDRRSVTGFLLYLNGGPIAWVSKRQPCVSLSSSEAEYYAASLAGLEVLFFRRILEQLGFLQRLPTMLLEDNQACIYMSRREGQINRAKHIDTRIHKLRELCATGVLFLSKIPTVDQVADAFTKGLSARLFCKHRAMYMYHP